MKISHQGKQLFKGTVILTIAALLTKILSALYRIPFQNIVGDVGFYIYQQVYPFYGMAIALTTYGFPVIISKLYTEEIVKNHSNVKQLFTICLTFLFGFGFLCFFLLYSASDWLAYTMKDPALSPLLRVIAFVFLLMPLISLWRGFFQAEGHMIPTAVSQVGEQSIRIITILTLAIFLVQHQFSLYQVGMGAMAGSLTGGLACVIILLFYWLRKRKQEPKLMIGEWSVHDSSRIIKTLILQAIPICISSMLLILIQLADSLNLYSLLIDSGIPSIEAKVLKGIYDRGQPLIQLGTVVATSMSLSLVPLITKEKMQSHSIELKEKIKMALKISILVGAGATMGLWSIIKPTNLMLFENTAGSTILAILSITILLASMILTMTAIMQGLGYIYFPAILIVAAFLLKYGFNVWLVPQLGTLGAALASVLTLFIVVVLFIIKLHKLLHGGLFTLRFYRNLIFACLIMVVVLKVFLALTDFIYGGPTALERVLAGIQALTAVALGGLFYVMVLIKTGLLNEEELSLLPLGSKFLIFLKNKKL